MARYHGFPSGVSRASSSESATLLTYLSCEAATRRAATASRFWSVISRREMPLAPIAVDPRPASGTIPEHWPSSALPRPGRSRTHALARAFRDGGNAPRWRWPLTGRGWVWGHGTLKGRTSLKQPGADPRLRYSGSPAPDRQAIVLALDDVVDLEDLGLTGLDPSVFQYRHEALAERVELLPRIPDLTDDELAVRFEGDVELES